MQAASAEAPGFLPQGFMQTRSMHQGLCISASHAQTHREDGIAVLLILAGQHDDLMPVKCVLHTTVHWDHVDRRIRRGPQLEPGLYAHIG